MTRASRHYCSMTGRVDDFEPDNNSGISSLAIYEISFRLLFLDSLESFVNSSFPRDPNGTTMSISQLPLDLHGAPEQSPMKCHLEVRFLGVCD